MSWGRLVITAFAGGHAREQPLGIGHLVQVVPFGAGLWLPSASRLFQNLLVVGGVLAGNHEAVRAQAPGERVEAQGGLPIR